MQREEILTLLKTVNLNENVIKHVVAVEKLSIETAKLILKNAPDFKIDLKLISDGALLHDIGRSVTHSIKHAIEGVKIARKYGFNEKILSIIENHIGAGISKEDAKELGLPVKNYFPLTIEEKVVANSDNLHSGDTRTGIDGLYNRLLNQGNQKAAQRVLDLYNEISELAGIKL